MHRHETLIQDASKKFPELFFTAKVKRLRAAACAWIGEGGSLARGGKYPVASEPPVSVDRLPNETVCWRSVTIHDAAKSSTSSEHQVLR